MFTVQEKVAIVTWRLQGSSYVAVRAQINSRFHHDGPADKTPHIVKQVQHPMKGLKPSGYPLKGVRNLCGVCHMSLCLRCSHVPECTFPWAVDWTRRPHDMAARSPDLMPMDTLCGDLSKHVCSPNAFPHYRSSGTALDKLLLP